MSDLGLDLFGDPVHPPKPESYGRRLTAAQRALADEGINPLVNTRGPAGRTCGECVHRLQREYPKCALGPRTRGPKTDVRAYWPACHRFEARP